MKGLPGFSAEASLARSRGRYAGVTSPDTATAAISPQGGPLSGCGWWTVCCTEHPDPDASAYCCRQAWLHGCDSPFAARS